MCIFVQDYVETAEQIDCPAPLPESPANALLTEMLVPAPYKGPEKKADKKAPGIRKGLRRKVAPEASSEDDEAHSSPEGEEEEEEAAPSGKDEGPERADQGARRGPRRKAVIPSLSDEVEALSSLEAGGSKKKLYLPALGRRKRGKPPRRGRLGRPRRERCPFRTTPPRPPIARRGGCPGGSP